MPSVVIQEHNSRSHHFDFRLEKDGVLKSWAVPKGLPDQPGTKRSSVQVGDHDLSFGHFEGEIPSGEYGAGKISIRDHGNYDLIEWTNDRVTFALHRNHLHGEFELIRFKHGKPLEWLIFKSRNQR